MRKHLLGDAQDIKKLATRLQISKKVQELNRRYPHPAQQPEAWTLAHAFSDLEESFLVFLEVFLPKLMNSSLGSDEIEDVLLDIGNEFEHILYHLRDPKFYSYLFPSKENRRSSK